MGNVDARCHGLFCYNKYCAFLCVSLVTNEQIADMKTNDNAKNVYRFYSEKSVAFYENIYLS